ncbi:MAG TPA: SAM-dependent chlorinase/fluorinase [Actinomycetes bacterium]|jgi:S-adenosylmethionine hydrolase|nr:SAM-dependent chlorinase/fluorinase [Actinomycetes bacterium]
MAGYEWITFLSDYGLEDNFVGVCHGVIARIAPHARVIDLSHAVQPQDVRQGATVLAQSVPYTPVAVHLAVVDPAVGTRRGQVAIQAGEHVLIGPDNGLLVWAAEALGGIRRAYRLTDPAYQLDQVSKTFHGRDVFAPAAAHVAAGVEVAALGRELDPAGLVRLVPATSEVDGDHVHGEILLVDHFGNLALNVSREELENVGVALGDRVELRVGGQTFTAPFGETFASVPAGRLVLHEDSFRKLTISVNQGRAAARLKAGAGDPVVVARMVR